MVELDDSTVVALHTSHRAQFDLDAVSDALGGQELGWLGAASQDGDREPGTRTFRSDLRLPLRAVGHEVEFRKAVIIDLGPVRRKDGYVSIDIAWRSANMAPLFPVFAGHLTIQPDRLILDGWYAPPGGRIGMAMDRMLLGIAARRTAGWFLGILVVELSGGGLR